jgi:hypothetical protein
MTRPPLNARSPFDPVDEDVPLIVHGEEVFNVTKTQQAGARLLDTVGVKELSRLVESAGVYEVNWLITEILNRRYPADVFGDGRIVEPLWHSNEGGQEFDPGAKWVALLRCAVSQVAE